MICLILQTGMLPFLCFLIQFYAYYPSSSFDTDNEVMTGNIPTVQTPTNGTYPQTLHYMTAYSTNSTFKFKNVCALLKITLTNNTTISRIKVVANPTLTNLYDQQFNYTNIAGGFTATIGSDGTATTTATGTKNTYVELRAAGDNGKAKTPLGNGTFYIETRCIILVHTTVHLQRLY